MDGPTDQNAPWWKITARILVGSVGLAGGVVGLSPLWSDPAKTWYADHGILGWVLVGALLLCGSVAFALLDQHYRKTLASTEVDVKAHAIQDVNHRAEECAADVNLMQEQLGVLMSGETLRRKLENLPASKVFARDLCRALDQLDADLNDRSKVVFDADLRNCLEGLKAPFAAYWHPLRELLDAPPQIQGTAWDLEIIRPPGGPWSGKTLEQRWNSFYEFVSTLYPLQVEFLGGVDRVEARLHRLHVEAKSSSQGVGRG